ncbi:MAG: heme NO-binding domain-containing protein [Anaerolineae bacterium]|nr:heme NO-binding domain-containing protein [Anaerolineae bacterium]
MIGIINKLLFEFVGHQWGAETEGKLRAETGTQMVEFRMDTYYPDTEWQAQLAAALRVTGQAEEAFVWDFGHYCGVELLKGFSGFVRGVTTTREVITRQPRIHNTLSSTFAREDRDRINEKFRLAELSDRTIMHYQSPNRLCTLYRSIAQWVADEFGDTIVIEEPRCQKRGDAECEIHIIYKGKKGQPA